MARLRYVGKPAASDQDVLTLKDLRAFEAALPGQYIRSDRIDQPAGEAGSGVVGIGANGRMGNAFLPADISQTTLTSSGKTKAGTLEVTGASTLAALTCTTLTASGNATVGGTLGVTGKITAASVDVGTGVVKGGAATLASVTAPTSAVDANTAPLYTVEDLHADTVDANGAITGSTLASTIGNIQSAADVRATGAVVAGTTVQGPAAAITGNVTAGSVISNGPVKGDTLDIAGAGSIKGVLTLDGALKALGQNNALQWLADRVTAVETSGSATVPWINPVLATYVSTDTNDPVRWRMVTDNGSKKVQLRGKMVISNTGVTTVFTLPVGSRPAKDMAPIAIARDSVDSAVAQIEIRATGAVVLTAKTAGVTGTITMNSAVLTASTVDPADTTTVNGEHRHWIPSNGAGLITTDWTDYNGPHSHSVTGSHNHTVPAHSHGLTSVPSPTFVSVNGVEFFID